MTLDVDQLDACAVVPLNLIVLVPWVALKFAPVTTTAAPAAPDVVERLVSRGATVNATPLLLTPPARTTTVPVVAVAGTGTEILVALHDVGVASVPLNETVLAPFVAPKFEPAMMTVLPEAPPVGERDVIDGAATTVNVVALLLAFDTRTTTFCAPVDTEGTVTTICVEFQLAIALAAVLPNLTVLLPWVDPNPVPLIVTWAPTAPDVGDSDDTLGAAAPRAARKKSRSSTAAKTGSREKVCLEFDLCWGGIVVSEGAPS